MVAPTAASHRASAPTTPNEAAAAASSGTTTTTSARLAGCSFMLWRSGARGDPVDRGELFAQVAHVRCRVDLGRAADALERLARSELAAVPMQVLAQPVAKGPEFTLLEAVVEIGEISDDAFPDLRRDQVPERIRGEVADRAARPMDILKHAVRVGRDRDPEVVPHPAVPFVRQLLERKLVCEHRLLELEAQDDVEVVRRFVRLDTDQRRLDEVDLPVPLLHVVVGQGGMQLL